MSGPQAYNEPIVILTARACGWLRGVLVAERQRLSGTGQIPDEALDAIAIIDALGRRFEAAVIEKRMAARGHAATRNDADADALLDTEKAAELLGLSVRTLTRRAKDGRIPARRIGGGYVFRTSTIRQYLGAQQ